MRKNNKIGPFVFKHKKTGLYFKHENEDDVDDLELAEKYKIPTYMHIFVGRKMLEYKEVPLHEEELKNLRKKKLKEL
jgi:hypothetical protein